MSKNKILMIYIFLTVVTLMAFWQVNHCDFINYDDSLYITENSHIQNGLTMDGIRWSFTLGYAANWHPLTWMSHMLDVQLFGLNPKWHHLTNLLFHIANTLFLFFVLRRMTKALWQSAFVAALFALHPLHVESVAWVAERKDVLSAFFWMLTMGAYCYYAERPGLRRYTAVLLLFILGLMAKPMLVTLPFVLLLLDYWPLGRFEEKQSERELRTKSIKAMSHDKRKRKSRKMNTVIVKEEVKAEKPADSKYRWALIRPLFWEKIPLFALTALSSVVTYIAQQKGGAVSSIEAIPLSARISNAFVSYVAYIEKMIWPNNLAVFYPHQKLWQPWQVLGAVLILIAITFIVIRTAKRCQYLTVGWLWYVCTLVPVIGLVQVGLQARADRYTYIPLIGLFIMAAWGIPEVLDKWRYREKVLSASAALILLCFFIVTWTQAGYWQNTFMLFDHVLKVTENNYIAYYSRGNAFAAVGNQRQAIEDYDRAIQANPKFAEAYYNRGNAFAAVGDQKQAIENYDRAIQANPKFAGAYYNRGNAFAAVGDQKQAIENYDRAIQTDPNYAKAYNNRGIAYKSVSNPKQAIEDYDRAIQADPKFAEAYYNRGNAYVALGDQKQAIEDYDKAIQADPKLASAYFNRAVVYDSFGSQNQAIEDMKAAAILGHKAAQIFLRSKGISW